MAMENYPKSAKLHLKAIVQIEAMLASARAEETANMNAPAPAQAATSRHTTIDEEQYAEESDNSF